MEQAKITQNAVILRYLRRKRSLTALEALRLCGCMRLGARIWELKRHGYPIEVARKRLPNGKWVAEYSYGA